MSIQLHMATVNICNARCHFCMYPKPENTYPKGVMSLDLYRKIIDDAKTIPEVSAIAFSALGEPTLDPHLVERVRYARKARPDWYPFELYTNGTGLTPEKFDALRDAGLDTLTVSLNAINARQHEQVMGLKGKYDQVVKNIRYARANARGKVDVLVKAVRNEDHFNADDQVVFSMQWGMRLRPDLIEGVSQTVLEANWAGGNRTIETRLGFDPNKCCYRALTQLSILWDGTVSLCCFDPLATTNFGDLNKQTIREIYNSERYVKFRESHDENRAAEHPLCAKCTRI